MAQATEENFKIEHSRDHLANERTFLAWIRTSRRFHQSNLLITVVTALMLVAAAVLVFYLVNTT